MKLGRVERVVLTALAYFALIAALMFAAWVGMQL